MDGGNRRQTTHTLIDSKNKHRIDCTVDEDAIPSSIVALGATASVGVQIISTVTTKAVREACWLVAKFDAAKFRYALVIFIAMCNIAFSISKLFWNSALMP